MKLGVKGVFIISCHLLWGSVLAKTSGNCGRDSGIRRDAFQNRGSLFAKTNLQFWHILANEEKIDQMIPTDIYSYKNKYKKECK